MLQASAVSWYPAASLLYFTKSDTPIFYIDPKPAVVSDAGNINYIAKTATEGMAMLAEKLRKEYL